MSYESNGGTHSADTVAGSQGARKCPTALQHGTDDSLRGVELIPDGLADCWHVWKQHHWEQAGNIDGHTGHGARTLPGDEKETSVSRTDGRIVNQNLLDDLLR